MMLRFLRRTAIPVVWLLLGYIVTHVMISELLISLLPALFGGSPQWGDTVVLTKSGDLLIERRTYLTNQRSYRRPDGTAVPLSQNDYKTFGLIQGAGYMGAVVGEPDSWDARIEQRTIPGEGENYFWYAVLDDVSTGRAYWEGYAVIGNTRVGYLSRNGFSTTRPRPEEMFELAPETGYFLNQALTPNNNLSGIDFDYSDLSNAGLIELVDPAAARPAEKSGMSFIPSFMVYLADRKGIYSINLRTQTVGLSWPGLRAKTLGIHTFPPVKKTRTQVLYQKVRLRTDDEILLCDPASKQIERIPIPVDMRTGNLSYSERAGTGPVLLANWYNGSNNRMVRYRIHWQKKDGSDEQPPLDFVLEQESTSLLPNGLRFALSCPVPLFALLAIPMSAMDPVRGPEPSPPYMQRLQAEWYRNVSSVAATALIGVVMAVWCWRRQRRYFAPGTMIWVPFVFLFGWPGMVAYLCHRDWPDLAVSPWLTGRPIEKPALKGTEIFA